MTRHERNRSLWALQYIAGREGGTAPTVREIGEAIGLASTSAVQYVLRRLEDSGYLRRGPCPHCGGQARDLFITELGRQELQAA